MKKIAVMFKNDLYFWVDTVTHLHDFAFAVLVNPKTGAVISRHIGDITVIDLQVLNTKEIIEFSISKTKNK